MVIPLLQSRLHPSPQSPTYPLRLCVWAWVQSFEEQATPAFSWEFVAALTVLGTPPFFALVVAALLPCRSLFSQQVGAARWTSGGALVDCCFCGRAAPFICMIPAQVGESFESCAVRELAEETGISSVTEMRVLPFTSNDIMPMDGKHYVTVFVELTVAADATAALTEASHREWRWISVDQIPEPRFVPLHSLINSGVLGS